MLTEFQLISDANKNLPHEFAFCVFGKRTLGRIKRKTVQTGARKHKDKKSACRNSVGGWG